METVVKFKADATQYNSAVRVMIQQNSALARSIQSLRKQSGISDGTIGAGDIGRGTSWNRFDKGGSSSGVGAMAASLATVGAIAAAAYGRAVARMAGELQDASDRMQIGTGELQRWGAAAQDTGGTIDDMAGALKKLRLAQGDDKKAGAFAVLGLDRSADAATLMDELSEKVKDGSLSAGQYAAAFALLGKNLDKVLAAMRSDLFSGKGVTIASAENVKAIDDLSDSLSRLWGNVKAGGINALGGLLSKVTGGGAIRATLDQLKAEQAAADRAETERLAKEEEKRAADEVAAQKKADDESQRAADLRARNDATSSAQMFAKLSPDQKRAMLQGQIGDLSKTMNNFDLPELQREQARQALLEKQGQLDGLKIDKERMADIGSDSMRRIGLFVGGGIGGRVSPELTELKAIRTAINRNSEVIKEAL